MGERAGISAIERAKIVGSQSVAADAPCSRLDVLDGHPGNWAKSLSFDRHDGVSHLADKFLLLLDRQKAPDPLLFEPMALKFSC